MINVLNLLKHSWYTVLKKQNRVNLATKTKRKTESAARKMAECRLSYRRGFRYRCFILIKDVIPTWTSSGVRMAELENMIRPMIK